MPLYLKLLQEAFSTGLGAVWPCIALLLLTGFVTSFIQAVLQIEDATFALLPKTLVMILIALFGGFGALGVFEGLARDFITHAPELVRRAWY
ncbi:flagellar biosynthetic protein FliQ [Acidocella sp.]|jgi:flagellar biosynthesis protein FliQ|uniref:flagellar biosynthetic protein FliQ n=1 Tax=Acidocella sp. TaxID=50710 RepID=UPI0026249086|nr:flagellar biosynthetic protein FliQ [Acidocella sp.]